MLSEAEFESNEFTDEMTASGHRYIGDDAVVVSLGQLWLSEDASILCGARLRKPLWVGGQTSRTSSAACDHPSSAISSTAPDWSSNVRNCVCHANCDIALVACHPLSKRGWISVRG